jgi:hypothetical protein
MKKGVKFTDLPLDIQNQYQENQVCSLVMRSGLRETVSVRLKDGRRESWVFVKQQGWVKQ